MAIVIVIRLGRCIDTANRRFNLQIIDRRISNVNGNYYTVMEDGVGRSIVLGSVLPSKALRVAILTSTTIC